MNLIKQETNRVYVDSQSRFARSEFSDALFSYLSQYYDQSYTDLVIICIGSDRSTGDSLGPLVGHDLSSRLKIYKDVHILGTLGEPVHAKNLQDNIDKINTHYENPFIVAIDACLGSFSHVGSICLSNAPLRPGAGVNKVLPPVGDISILGIVNTSGFMGHTVLQCTRLNLVMNLANIISSSLVTCLWRLNKK